MNIILTCLTNFQEYILINIYQLIKLENKNIYVITNKNLFKHFEIVKSYIHLIDADELIDSFNFNSKTTLDNNYRGGFWKLTSQRFFVIYEFMKKQTKNNFQYYNPTQELCLTIIQIIHEGLEKDIGDNTIFLKALYYYCDYSSDVVRLNTRNLLFVNFARVLPDILYLDKIKDDLKF